MINESISSTDISKSYATFDQLKILINKLSLNDIPYPIILIGGTNGKGSTCTYLSNILEAAGYSVGLFTSPHIFEPNERIQVNNLAIDNGTLNQLIEIVKKSGVEIASVAPHNDSFNIIDEFSTYTLATHLYFKTKKIDIAICEVGLGGRLDPTNLFEPTISVITSIDYDHMEILGNTLNQIGLEKCAIFRPNKMAFIGVKNPPQSVIDYAKQINCDLQIYATDFGYDSHEQSFDVWNQHNKYFCIPLPHLRGKEQLINASLAISVLSAIKDKFPLGLHQIKSGIINSRMIGRCQIMPGQPQVILDVAHNPQAISHLVQNMLKLPFAKHSYAVFGIAHEKDIESIMQITHDKFDKWFIAPIDSNRQINNQKLYRIMSANGINQIQMHNSITEATQTALSLAKADDRIVCFGSFLVVRDAYKIITT